MKDIFRERPWLLAKNASSAFDVASDYFRKWLEMGGQFSFSTFVAGAVVDWHTNHLEGLTLSQELAEWRSGKRRIFFRVKFTEMLADQSGEDRTKDFTHHREARDFAAYSKDATLFCVTKSPKGAKR